MSKYEIESNAPKPRHRVERPRLPPLPFDKLAAPEDGQHQCIKVQATSEQIPALRQRMHRFQKSNPKVRLSLNTVDENTVRIYRIEDRE